jgi:hypothetical protein
MQKFYDETNTSLAEAKNEVSLALVPLLQDDLLTLIICSA